MTPREGRRSHPILVRASTFFDKLRGLSRRALRATVHDGTPRQSAALGGPLADPCQDATIDLKTRLVS
ncbi:MAG: hypothetical protein ABSF69_26925 [Polyangiaceae bacterium]|jgi:hypothetical protein